MHKIKVGDKFFIEGSDVEYICVSVEGGIVYGRPVGSLFVSVRLSVDCFIKNEKKV